MSSRPVTRSAPDRRSWYISPSDITDRSANPIGRGGFGEVFTGTYFGSKVAIKQLLGTCNSRVLADYNNEIDIWQKLNHPHILPLLGACDQDEDGNPIPPFMVSPFMPNGTLCGHVSDPDDPVSLDEKLRLLYQVASGMAYLHGRRIIHGDLKALNILLDASFNAVVTDFGLSRTKHTSASLNLNKSSGPNGGTDGYMAPEMLDDDSPSGTTMKTDVYAFAITIYEVLNDANPVWTTASGQAMKPFQILSQLLQHKRPKRLGDIPDDIWALIERCWAHDPADRPSFPDILAVLQPYNRPAAPSQPNRPAELQFDGIDDVVHLPASLVSRAKQGDPDACLEVAKLVSHGLPARHEHWKLAVQLFKAASDGGNLEASFQLAWLALLGEGVPQNDRSALWHWQEVSNKSTDSIIKSIATHMLGWMHYLGRGTMRDEQKGVKIIRENKSDEFLLGEGECLVAWSLTSSDSPAAQMFFDLCRLGSDRDWLCKHLAAMCLIHGFGTIQDQTKAAGIFESLAREGHSHSQNWLGWCCWRGWGVPENYPSAFEWFTKSANQGNSYGYLGVGWCCYYGTGVAEDKPQAVEWYRKSAERGNRYGQCWLGDRYQYGQGVAKDIVTAILWYRKSADQGDELAINELKKLGRWP